MKLKKFLNKKTDKKTKIAILKKMLKACDASGTGTVTVIAARKIINESQTRASNDPRLPAALAMARGPGTELQAASFKLQASSFTVDQTEL